MNQVFGHPDGAPVETAEKPAKLRTSGPVEIERRMEKLGNFPDELGTG
jgi:hypothetical protein